MIHTPTAFGGMVTAPHHLAAEAGRDVLREGGNAVEAMIAAAAAIAVVYPHMNSIGGDCFWLVHVPGADPVGIDACGGAAAVATPAFYRARGHESIPARGPLAANTVAGTVSGWQSALSLAAEMGGTMPLARLLEPAVEHARRGVPVTAGQARLTRDKLSQLADVAGFAGAFLAHGSPPLPGTRFVQERLATTLEALAEHGLDGFYRGDLARRIAADLARAGSPVTAADLARHAALVVRPLSVRIAAGTVFNLPPPTQGLASLMILGIFDRLGVGAAEGFAHVHGLVEATKQAFLVRDRDVTDPAYMGTPPASYLSDEALAVRAAIVDPARALPWPQAGGPGDTIWMGAVDRAGRVVSFIQSIYWEFGSGVVLEDTGIQWQNRGSSFSLDDAAVQTIAPGRRPFHTLNPALAHLADGRVMSYGTMGGEGQPQTQAAVFTRYAMFGHELQGAVSAPRWLLGRTWGDESTTLKLESRFDPRLVASLRDAGHDVEIVGDYDDAMGHAGAVVFRPDGLMEGAADPRSDGGVAAL